MHFLTKLFGIKQSDKKTKSLNLNFNKWGFLKWVNDTANNFGSDIYWQKDIKSNLTGAIRISNSAIIPPYLRFGDSLYPKGDGTEILICGSPYLGNFAFSYIKISDIKYDDTKIQATINDLRNQVETQALQIKALQNNQKNGILNWYSVSDYSTTKLKNGCVLRNNGNYLDINNPNEWKGLIYNYGSDNTKIIAAKSNATYIKTDSAIGMFAFLGDSIVLLRNYILYVGEPNDK